MMRTSATHVFALAVGLLMPLGCASNKSAEGKNDAATQKKDKAAASQNSKTNDPAAPDAPSVEEALVRVKDKQFPPVDVGPWLCEPKHWTDKGQVLLHCTAPSGTKDLQAALRADPAVADAAPVK